MAQAPALSDQEVRFHAAVTAIEQYRFQDAVEILEKLASQGFAPAQVRLGLMLLTGEGIVADAQKGLELIRRAADSGNPLAQRALGSLYLDDSPPLEKDDSQAIAWYRRAAEQGDATAQYVLGAMYINGRGVTKDYAQAANWFRMAAEQGNASAQNELGFLYGAGHGVPLDVAQSVAWYRKAAEQGDAVAQFNLGVAYDNGRGVPVDEAQAVTWFRKAAEQGNAPAQFNLGVAYEKGRGVARDDAQAAAWYIKAAEQGIAGAQTNLGVMYENGRGVVRDDAQAVDWYTKAAGQGSASAQNNLGNMYLEGRGGLAESVETAITLQAQAARQGDEVAIKNLEKNARLLPALRVKSTANIRNLASADADVIGQANAGDVVFRLGLAEDWVPVYVPRKHQVGFVSASLVSEQRPASTTGNTPVISSGVAARPAAAWTPIGKDALGMNYVDLGTVRRSGNFARIWVVFDFDVPQPLLEGDEPFRSLREQMEFDCSADAVRPLARSAHTDTKARGRVVYDEAEVGKWRPVEPGAVTEKIFKIACGGTR